MTETGDWGTAVTLTFATIVTTALGAPAFAQETAKQDAVTAAGATTPRETLIPKLRVGGDDFYLEFYGQLNKGVLVFDDGGSTLGYVPVDNGNSSSRAGLRLNRNLVDGL